jgi:glycosyltransferase involved in cell wall biosynthesis
MQSKTKLLLVVNFLDGKDPFKVGGVEYHRLLIPYINLAKTHNIEVHQTNEITENINLSDFDLVVFSRVVSNYNRDEEVLQQLKKIGIPFIIDIDDYWRLPTNHLLYKQWQQHNMVKRIELALKNATAITTTTPHLGAQIRKLNKNVVVAPNAIDPDQPQFKPRPTQSDKTRIGWVGGLCHTDDIPLLERGFKKLYAEKDLQWKYTVNLCGYSPQNFDVWGYYEHIFTAGQSQPNYHRVPGRDIRNYAHLYNGLDVCLVPLADTPFNRCKSPLKLLEAGWFKKACITSKVYPYTLMGEHYKNLLFVENNKIDWHKNMKKLIQSPNLQKDLAERLHQTVKENYLIDKVNMVRGEFIGKFI